MNNDRFTDCDDEVRQLVLDFERTVMRGENQFYDVDELETIIDYYLEVRDEEPLLNAIVYAEQLYPDSSEIKIRRAHWYIAHQKLDRALEILLRLEDQNPEDTDVAYTLGVLYSEKGEPEKAIDYYLMAATDGWQTGRIYANIAEEYYRMQRFDEAIEYYHKAFASDSCDDDVLYNFLDTCEQADRCDHAAEYLDRYAHDHPYCREAWYCLGCAYRDLGLFEQAAEALHLAIAIDKNYTPAYVELSRTQEDNQQVGEAATTLLQLIDVVPDREEVFRALGELFLRQDNVETAALYFRKAIDENVSDAVSLASLGLCYLRLADLSLASSYAKRALAADPDCPEALCCSALVYDCKGNFEMANDFFDRLMLTNNYTEQQCRYYVLFLYSHELYDTLMTFAEDSLAIYPNDPFYSTYLAAAYYHTNRYNSLRRVIANAPTPMLHEVCPELWQNPLMAPILPPLPNEDDNN